MTYATNVSVLNPNHRSLAPTWELASAESFLDCCYAVLHMHWQELIAVDHDFTTARLTSDGRRFLLPVIRHGVGASTLPFQALEALNVYKQAERFALRRISEPGT